MSPISPWTRSVHHRHMNGKRLSWNNLTTWGRAHLCWASVVLGVFLVALIGAAVSQQPEGTCTGIGFGCQVSGPDMALLLLLFGGPVVLAVLALGHAVIGIAHVLSRRIRHSTPTLN